MDTTESKTNRGEFPSDLGKKVDLLRGLSLHGGPVRNRKQVAALLGVNEATISRMCNGRRPISLAHLQKLTTELGRDRFGYQLFFEPFDVFQAELLRLTLNNAKSGTSILHFLSAPRKQLPSCRITISPDTPATKGLRGIGADMSPSQIQRFQVDTKVKIEIEGPALSHFVLLEATSDQVVSIAPSKHAPNPRLSGERGVGRHVIRGLNAGEPTGRYTLFGFFMPDWIVPWQGLGEQIHVLTRAEQEKFATRLRGLAAYGQAKVEYLIVD